MEIIRTGKGGRKSKSWWCCLRSWLHLWPMSALLLDFSVSWANVFVSSICCPEFLWLATKRILTNKISFLSSSVPHRIRGESCFYSQVEREDWKPWQIEPWPSRIPWVPHNLLCCPKVGPRGHSFLIHCPQFSATVLQSRTQKSSWTQTVLATCHIKTSLSTELYRLFLVLSPGFQTHYPPLGKFSLVRGLLSLTQKIFLNFQSWDFYFLSYQKGSGLLHKLVHSPPGLHKPWYL